MRQFFCAVFGPTDRVVLAQLTPEGGWLNHSHVRDDAITWLSRNYDTANLYFRASSHDGRSGFSTGNCVQTGALFVDIDYGSVGHKGLTPFGTLDDVVAYLLTCPLRPSMAWHTGHGVQAAFRLTEPIVFGFGEARTGPIGQYLDLTPRLVRLMCADTAQTPEHAYRVPMTLNHKPNTEPLRGSVLWSNATTYTMEQIQLACAHYGIDDLLAAEQKRNAATPAADPDLRTVPYGELPERIREEIEGSGERSERLFGIVGQLVRASYADPTILDAVQHGKDFTDKYDSRAGGLAGQVQTCIDRIRSGRYVYRSDVAPPLRIYNVPVTVRLADCAPMPPALDRMLGRYEVAANIQLLDRVRQAARLHEHLFATHQTGVIESPCGAGKSVWGLCHIALHVAPPNRYLYVVETVEALYRAADLLERLTDQPVGRLHGHNAQQCRELCGQPHTWRECDPHNSKSACRSCAAADRCAYHNRNQHVTRPILCMTHSGLIRAMEDGSELLRDANLVIDEGLSPFGAWQVSISDLEHLQRHVPDCALSRLFPHTSMAAQSELRQWRIADGADVFARRHYQYRDQHQTTALRDPYEALRVSMGAGLRPMGRHRAADLERATETLAGLLSFFRPSRYDDATYAYHEARIDGEWVLTCRRSRFSLAMDRPYRSLWILNASAELTPHPYPDRMAVYRCADLPPNGHLVTLHLVRANPTKTRQEEIRRVSDIIMLLGEQIRRHRRILLAVDKDSKAVEPIQKAIRRLCPGADILVLRRGTIKGVNHAGDRTLAYLGSVATFTGLDDCALHACLQLGRTFATRPYVYTESGTPNWPGGRMLVPAMRNYYALRSLDEIYQSIWRTAVRNDQPVEAIIAVPDEHWITALWRTVMPGLHIESAYREHRHAEIATVAGQPREVRWDFERDDRLYGLRIIEMQAGKEMPKQQIAQELGYADWERNKATIMTLLDPFFEPGSNIRMLRRRADPGMDQPATVMTPA